MTRLRIRSVAFQLDAEGDADLIGQVLGEFIRRGRAAQAAVDALTPAPRGINVPEESTAEGRERRGVKRRAKRRG